MPRLTSPTGVTVNVSEEKAATLRSVGYEASEGEKPAAKKAATPKKAAAKSD